MSHGSPMRCVRALACASLLFACAPAATHARARGEGSALSAVESARRQLVVRLRSFVPGASGRVVVEPSEEGGRVRLLASRLPAPESVSAGARVYVVWATGGEVRRVGELRRDARGDASFEFAHPSGFTSYSLVVTAERDARATYPAGAFVFSTRAGEVSAFYPPKPEPRAGGAAVRSRTVAGARANDAATNAPAPSSSTAAPSSMGAPSRSTTTGVRAASPPTVERAASSSTGTRAASSSTSARAASTANVARPATGSRALTSEYVAEFYESINSAVEDPSSARALTLEGAGGAPRRARGDALVATREGTAYVRVRFRNVPPPARYGVRKYVMWAQLPEDGPLFLRALPARRLNRGTIYARRRNVNSGDFSLSVTAERRYPRARPRGRRVLTTVGGAASARN